METKRNRHLRKRVTEEVSEMESVDTKSCLEGIRVLQKQRAKKALTGQIREEKQVQDSGDQKQVLDAYVKETTVKTTTEIQEMDRYIEHHMKERLGQKLKSESTKLSLEEIQDMELFEVPERLKSSGTREVSIPGLMTGIKEVRLPISNRLKNIEDTEQAKKLLLESGTREGYLTKKRRKLNLEEDQQGEEGVDDESTLKAKRSLFVISFGRQQTDLEDQHIN